MLCLPKDAPATDSTARGGVQILDGMLLSVVHLHWTRSRRIDTMAGSLKPICWPYGDQAVLDVLAASEEALPASSDGDRTP